MSDSATLWTAARQAPLSMGFPRQESRSGLFFIGLRQLLVVACGILVPRPGIEPGPPALGVQSVSRWTARVPNLSQADILPEVGKKRFPADGQYLYLVEDSLLCTF